jgi:hypothetical protein
LFQFVQAINPGNQNGSRGQIALTPLTRGSRAGIVHILDKVVIEPDPFYTTGFTTLRQSSNITIDG